MAFEKPTRHRLENIFLHHKPDKNQERAYEAMRNVFLNTALYMVENTPCSPEQMRSLNALDEAMMLANAAIARNTEVGK